MKYFLVLLALICTNLKSQNVQSAEESALPIKIKKLEANILPFEVINNGKTAYLKKQTIEFPLEIEYRGNTITHLNLFRIKCKDKFTLTLDETLRSGELERLTVDKKAKFEFQNAQICGLIKNTYFQSIDFTGNIDNLLLFNSKFKSYVEVRSNIKHLTLQRSNFDGLVDLRAIKIDSNLVIRNCVLKGGIDLRYTQLPNKITIGNSDIQGVLDLSNIKLPPNREKVILYLNQNNNINNLKLDYQYFTYAPYDSLAQKSLQDSVMGKSSIVKVYQDLMDIQKRYNYTLGYEMLDVEYQRFKSNYLLEFLKEHWDYFGYKKYLIFRNTALLFLLFVLPMLFAFRFCIQNVYCPKSLERVKAQPWLQLPFSLVFLFRSIPYAVYYSALVFFGLKMDLENIQVSGMGKVALFKRIGVIYLFLMYFMGIVCTAYLANYILQS